MVKRREPGPKPPTIRIPAFGITLIQIAAAIGILIVSAIVIWVYVNFDVVSHFVVSRTELFLSWSGLGISLICIWMGVCTWLVRSANGRSLLRHHYRVILGIVGLTVAAWGSLAFYIPQNGFPGWTNISFDVPVGGRISLLISGTGTLQATIRLLIITILSTIIIRPKLGLGLGNLIKTISLTLYLGLFAVSRAISKMYVENNNPKSIPALPNAGQVEEPDMPPEILTPHIRESEIIGNIEGMKVEVEVDSNGNVTRSEEEWVRGADRMGYFVADSETIADTTIDEHPTIGTNDSRRDFEHPQQSVIERDGAKFNRFWKEATSEEISAENFPSTGSSEVLNEQSQVNSLVDQIKPTTTRWEKPNPDILHDLDEGGISREDIRITSDIIKNTFAEYRIEIEVAKVRPGPAVTMYGIEPGWVRKYKRIRVKDESGNPKLDNKGKQIVAQQEEKTRVSVDNILRREKDLSLALKTPSLRIETPVMGESLLGIEVPNPSPSIVSLKRVMKSKSFRLLNKKSMLPVALGRGSDGDEVVFDLTRMPHLLIAGATGSGKSVCMNAIISCLIMERTPAELQMLLIDPKRVELTPYNGVPHLITPVVVETDRVVNLLKGLTREMMDRYRTMEEVGVRNIEAHNQIRPRDKMPYIVVAIDELADLMMTAAFDVEQSICRLAQLGRATGIHLIIATQRPSVDVITGLIKANFPSRISFGVTSQVDSRTILDATGAERLLGRGDMLYQPIDGTRPTRVQSVFISDEEIYGIVTHWKDIPWAARVQIELHNPGEEIIDKSVIGSTNNTNNQDELVDRAIELAQRHSKLSTSLLQRRLRIGYPRAARLMDELEDMGIVSTSDGSKSRDVIIR